MAAAADGSTSSEFVKLRAETAAWVPTQALGTAIVATTAPPANAIGADISSGP